MHTIDKANIKSSQMLKCEGLIIDTKLSFRFHIGIICKSASNQLNALVRLKMYLGPELIKGLCL